MLSGSRLVGAAKQVEVTRYDVDRGLPQTMVNHVLQDSDGFLWLGTGDGLARFNSGERFVVYKHDGRDSTSLSNNRIWGLAEADAQHLWVGTRSDWIAWTAAPDASSTCARAGRTAVGKCSMCMPEAACSIRPC